MVAQIMIADRRVEPLPVAIERRRGRGRPRLRDGEDTSSVNVRMSASQYDRVCVEALRQDVSISHVIRHALDLWLFS